MLHSNKLKKRLKSAIAFKIMKRRFENSKRLNAPSSDVRPSLLSVAGLTNSFNGSEHTSVQRRT